ncbi:hypothetical protein VFPPC_13634 [Pochonia chlamydosporia 170]|uniref:Uncharacterized protein n=1 Tax=Pochonia chlamydosporia 170 TaxID=1380566 RepID=A0A179FSH7_METCM|nr:hypothetical protein VFPPC_13634 [Pochonia chlamydosporia 170]OAQ68160.1 hypothetical protein VFPPC_13634 [Pochonia chlamydosporia 170]
MTDSAASAKRRHILSSINQDDPASDNQIGVKTARLDDDYHGVNHEQEEISREASPREERPLRNEQDDNGGDDKNRSRRSRLKLKSSKSRRRRSRSRHRDDERREQREHDGKSHSSRSSRHYHRRRHRHRHRSPTPPNPFEPEPLDPEVAFRESLFDAMADDEGASYWESVYGQPIHVYSNERAGPTGELEQMTDEQYAAYVRQKMWEKTHAGLLEERAKREERRKQKKEEERIARKLHQDMEQSLRRGEERRQKRRWEKQWEEYTGAWTAQNDAPKTLAWPVDGGQREDINDKGVRSFFIHGLNLEDIGAEAFMAKLKQERIRWHPDKVQQRFGLDMESEVMKDVTAVFQIIDKLWEEVRR